MGANRDREEEIFDTARELADDERAAYLAERCGQDADLRQRIEGMLAADAAAGEFFKTHEAPLPTVILADASLSPSIEKAGDRIGRYKLLQQIGEGGCGIVYMAEQEEPVRRRVALKVIKLGMDTKQVIARFEAERQALALMDHPNIAKIYDAGITDNPLPASGHPLPSVDEGRGQGEGSSPVTRHSSLVTSAGRPFFVMELVRGTKLTEFCDQKNLSPPERLELFIQVCQAIQHAHQKGVIHRDIKPSNILVTIVDGKPVPKVIDFGIAKATNNQRLTDKTVFTAFEQFIGTPAYMSPEQAEPSGVDIDTRTDIYSLGVVLYELLTGGTPFDQKELLAAGLDGMRRIIREGEPPRPSARLSTMAADALTTTAQHRHTEPPKLIHQVRGDLDWIVMKCLEKERDRRYETANGLAADIRRHLECEPVVARPPSKLYEFQKTVRRHKIGFAATAAIILVLAAGITMTFWQAKRAVAALDELRTTAPAFAAEARSLVAKERFDEAVAKLDYAIKLRPDAPEYRVAKGDLLQSQFKLAEAAAVYREALRLKPGLVRAEDSAKLCDELLATPPDKNGKLSRESLARLHLALQLQQRPVAELMPVARLLGEEKKLLLEYWLARLNDLPISAEKPLKQRLTIREDGLLALDLSNTKVADLAPFAGIPLGSLNLAYCEQITDFAPLHEFRSLTALDLHGTKVTDLSPLNGLPLEKLGLDETGIFDIAALRGMKLKMLLLRSTRVADLSPLTGMPLTFFDASTIPAENYSPLAGAPLERCSVQNSPVRDLSFLRDSPVKQLTLYGCNDVRGFAVLAGLKSLNLLILPDSYRNLPAEELAAIAALRTHPKLRSIDTAERRTGGWEIDTAQSKEEFWKAWDSEQALTDALRKGGFTFNLTLLPDGKYRLTVENQPLSDLSFLKDAPIGELLLRGTRVSDLRPLERLALTRLDIRQTPVSDLSPLRAPVLSASLRQLDLWRIPATDFFPVAACTNLDQFDAANTVLSNLEVVRGRKLRVALLSSTRITDISVLAGMPLERVTLGETAVTDIRPLLQCPTLKELVLPHGAREVNALRSLPRLAMISYGELSGGYSEQAAEEFWFGNEHGGILAKEVSILSERSVRAPHDNLLAMKVAALQAWFGQDAEYRATCQRMIEAAERAAKTEDVRERAAKNWCLRASGDVAMLQRVLALAREAATTELVVDQRPWYQQALGMAEFRAGHDEAAEAAFLRAEKAAETGNWHPELRPFILGPARLFRAMMFFRKGKTEEAKRLFQEAEAQMPPMPENAARILPVKVTQDQLLCWLACREARALLIVPPARQPASAPAH